MDRLEYDKAVDIAVQKAKKLHVVSTKHADDRNLERYEGDPEPTIMLKKNLKKIKWLYDNMYMVSSRGGKRYLVAKDYERLVVVTVL